MTQKINTKSSTEAEMVVANAVLSHFLWTKNLIKKQGYYCDPTFHQDNKSVSVLERNGM